MDIEKSGSKDKKHTKILEDFQAADLNPNPEGGEEEEEEQYGQGNRQEVRCQQQWCTLGCIIYGINQNININREKKISFYPRILRSQTRSNHSKSKYLFFAKWNINASYDGFLLLCRTIFFIVGHPYIYPIRFISCSFVCVVLVYQRCFSCWISWTQLSCWLVEVKILWDPNLEIKVRQGFDGKCSLIKRQEEEWKEKYSGMKRWLEFEQVTTPFFWQYFNIKILIYVPSDNKITLKNQHGLELAQLQFFI